MAQLGSQGATAFAMDCIPRLLSRGQTFDALSSQVSEKRRGGREGWRERENGRGRRKGKRDIKGERVEKGEREGDIGKEKRGEGRGKEGRWEEKMEGKGGI